MHNLSPPLFRWGVEELGGRVEEDIREHFFNKVNSEG